MNKLFGKSIFYFDFNTKFALYNEIIKKNGDPYQT